MKELFGGIYKEKKVLVTGHTGFKGSWLSLWLLEIGAKVIGYSLNFPTKPCHFELLNLSSTYKNSFIHIIGDIRDFEKLKEIIQAYKPEIVFHLAAQSLVRKSYKNPLETFETNILGTVNILEACRESEGVKVIINVTSDKCYENKEWVWGYRETDRLGGNDPYSASKACSEIVTQSYRKSFFSNSAKLLASVRAGNVIGGGDWGEDRIIPDLVKAVSLSKKALIRNPNSIRPWQHVLEPLSGYLLLGQKLLEGEEKFADAWNFGPDRNWNLSVAELSKIAKDYWDEIDYEFVEDDSAPQESKILKLDCSKANSLLGWKPVWNINKAIEMTINWYKDCYKNKQIKTLQDINSYIIDAKGKGYEWTG
ncbi:CDP-glucose 4,6-dehydratase [Thermodesulfovibrio hydrogeniphilus]